MRITTESIMTLSCRKSRIPAILCAAMVTVSALSSFTLAWGPILSSVGGANRVKLEKLLVASQMSSRLHARIPSLDDEDDAQETAFLLPQKDKGRNDPETHPDCIRQRIKKTFVRGAAGLVLMLQIMSSSSLPSNAASDASNLVRGQRYWTIMKEGEEEGRITANKALMDHVVGTIDAMFYDHSGGAVFVPHDFHVNWKKWVKQPENQKSLASREGVIHGMQWLTEQLNDPFSRYLTRDQLREELSRSNDGFLGLGAMVELPSGRTFFGSLRTPVMSEVPPTLISKTTSKKGTSNQILNAKTVQKLPVLTAVAPDSPAERAGLTVGDRIVAVQQDSFLGLPSTQAVKDKLNKRYQAENYAGTTELTIAKPVYATMAAPSLTDDDDFRDVIVGYRQRRVRLTSASVTPPLPYVQAKAITSINRVPVAGGDSLVHYQLLSAPGGQSSSLFLGAGSDNEAPQDTVAYIRLTRFSKASTASFLKTIELLEHKAGSSPRSYIIDLRNNYGGVIQEAMLTASSLLRDPHAVLCYTMNSRGGFTPHDVLEYVADRRYPGYLLSREDKSVTLKQLHRDMPVSLQNRGDFASPPSSYASIHEQRLKRGINTPTYHHAAMQYQHQAELAAQKNIVLLVNEGTASAAEVFASALHDNGRTVAVVGSRTYGKGLVQHTFPMPDGGGLRLTVAEYLTPALRHVTHVGGAQFDQATGVWVGGGIKPDLYCESKQGIPTNIGADLCVGVALDALQEANSISSSSLLYGSSVPQVNSGKVFESGHVFLSKRIGGRVD